MNSENEAAPSPQWKPLDRVQRRVAGVLVEKAKTTPEHYPLSLNALTNGCNQKNNRSPQMHLDQGDVEVALDDLRTMSASSEVQAGIQGTGRVAKYKHRLYEWMGVDKAELAVMAELLMRGEQTVGELRTRAARMEPIADVSALRPILQGLIEKGLVIELTPPGRGQLVTHALYQEQELEQIRARYSEAAVEESQREPRARQTSQQVDSIPTKPEDSLEFQQLKQLVAELRTEIQDLRHEFDAFKQYRS